MSGRNTAGRRKSTDRSTKGDDLAPSQSESQPTVDPQVGLVMVALLLVLSLSWWWYGGSIKGYFILGDLRHYGTVVRDSDLSLVEKEWLIRVIHGLEDQVREGNCPSHWANTDEAVRSLLAEDISEDEVRLLVLELERVSDNLDDE